MERVLIYCKEGGLEQFYGPLEELGFKYERSVKLGCLDYELGAFKYLGNDVEKGMEQARSIDDCLVLGLSPVQTFPEK